MLLGFKVSRVEVPTLSDFANSEVADRTPSVLEGQVYQPMNVIISGAIWGLSSINSSISHKIYNHTRTLHYTRRAPPQEAARNPPPPPP